MSPCQLRPAFHVVPFPANFEAALPSQAGNHGSLSGWLLMCRECRQVPGKGADQLIQGHACQVSVLPFPSFIHFLFSTRSAQTFTQVLRQDIIRDALCKGNDKSLPGSLTTARCSQVLNLCNGVRRHSLLGQPQICGNVYNFWTPSSYMSCNRLNCMKDVMPILCIFVHQNNVCKRLTGDLPAAAENVHHVMLLYVIESGRNLCI